MASYGVAVGTAAGSVVPGVGNIIGAAVGTVFDEVFGSVDKGQWVGNRFVPGDLANRQRFVSEQLRIRGLTQFDIDQSAVENMLYVQSGWQGNVTSYLDRIVDAKVNQSYNPNRDSNSPVSVDTTIPGQTTLQVLGAQTTFSNTFIIFIAGALIVFAFFKLTK